MVQLNHIRCFILDMDGTFYLGDSLLPGALAFMDYLQRSGRDYLFLTNNSSCSASHYVAKLARLGWQTDESHVLTSGEATALYLKEKSPGARVFLLGTPDLEDEVARHGFRLTDNNPDYVVLGFDKTLTYDKLVKACAFITAGVPYIATHPDINCPTKDGFIPDCGAIMACIKASTGHDPYIIGKPRAAIIEAVFRRRPYPPSQAAIVGDRLYTDIATGKNADITSILVLSGETQVGDLPAADVTPDYVFANLGALRDELFHLDKVGGDPVRVL